MRSSLIFAFVLVLHSWHLIYYANGQRPLSTTNTTSLSDPGSSGVGLNKASSSIIAPRWPLSSSTSALGGGVGVGKQALAGNVRTGHNSLMPAKSSSLLPSKSGVQRLKPNQTAASVVVGGGGRRSDTRRNPIKLSPAILPDVSWHTGNDDVDEDIDETEDEEEGGGGGGELANGNEDVDGTAPRRRFTTISPSLVSGSAVDPLLEDYYRRRSNGSAQPPASLDSNPYMRPNKSNRKSSSRQKYIELMGPKPGRNTQASPFPAGNISHNPPSSGKSNRPNSSFRELRNMTRYQPLQTAVHSMPGYSLSPPLSPHLDGDLDNHHINTLPVTSNQAKKVEQQQQPQQTAIIGSGGGNGSDDDSRDEANGRNASSTSVSSNGMELYQPKYDAPNYDEDPHQYNAPNTKDPVKTLKSKFQNNVSDEEREGGKEGSQGKR